MGRQHTWKDALICTIIAASCGIFTMAIAEEKKEIPDHTNFTSCQTCHAEKQKMWEASGHSKAINAVLKNDTAPADCYGCHSTEGFAAKRQGNKVDTSKKDTFHTVSCLACHDPRNSKLPHKLVADTGELCDSCHPQRDILKGQGARGIEDLRNVHSAVACSSCHMTEGNHLMKVLRPDDPNLSEKRIDTCTSCHKDNNRKARAKQLQDWQSEFKEKMDVLQADVNAINAVLKEKPELLNADLKKKFDDLKFNLSNLVREGSRGAHNFDYALEIMAAASKDLREIKTVAK
jgi:predicted CXXCH cytochrome family protein